MKWETILGAVFLLYAKCFGLCGSYLLTKIMVARSRSRQNPPAMERYFRYVKCLGVVAVVAFLLGGAMTKSGKDAELYQHAITVFIAVAIPVLFGVAAGHSTTEKYPAPGPPGDEMG